MSQSGAFPIRLGNSIAFVEGVIIDSILLTSTEDLLLALFLGLYSQGRLVDRNVGGWAIVPLVLVVLYCAPTIGIGESTTLYETLRSSNNSVRHEPAREV